MKKRIVLPGQGRLVNYTRCANASRFTQQEGNGSNTAAMRTYYITGSQA